LIKILFNRRAIAKGLMPRGLAPRSFTLEKEAILKAPNIEIVTLSEIEI